MMKQGLFFKVLFVLFMAVSLAAAPNLSAQENIDFTLDSAVEIMMESSYRIRNLKMGIEQRRLYLKAEQAGLKSRIYMNLITPNLDNSSDYKWNSTIGRNEIFRENTNRWQMDLAIRQPIILFGFPTNGNISLNYKIWRYNQLDDGSYTSFYNRLYLRLEQPFFTPNDKKNDLESAKLELEEQELEYISDQVEIIEDVSSDYYEIFELAYKNKIFSNHITELEKIEKVVADIVVQDPSRILEKKQIELELSNAKEALMANQSELRLEKVRMKQRLRLSEEADLNVETPISIIPFQVNQVQAMDYGFSLRPSLRLSNINKRKQEIRLDNVKARDAFRVNLEVTYGLEKQDERFKSIWNQYDNTNSITINAYVPIWDWGQRRSRIAAQKISLEREDLRIEERQKQIRIDINNAIINLNEYQARASNMQDNIKIADDILQESIQQYKDNKMLFLNLLQNVIRQKDTDLKFLDIYLEYRESILSLMVSTYYDYENNISLIDKFRAQAEENEI
ncbi:TolC family protein [Acidobacteriota bacterium]